MTRGYRWKRGQIHSETWCLVDEWAWVHPNRVGAVLVGWSAVASGRSEFFTRRCQAKRWVEWIVSLRGVK